METLLQAVPHITGLTLVDGLSIPHSLTSFADDQAIILASLYSQETVLLILEDFKITTVLELNKDRSKLILAQEPTFCSFFGFPTAAKNPT